MGEGAAERTKRRLLDAAEALARAEGGPGVTTTRLAEAAGLSVGAVYKHFASREAVLAAAFARADARMTDAWFAAMPDLGVMPPEAAAQALTASYLAAAEADPGFVATLEAAQTLPPGARAGHGGPDDGHFRLFLERLGLPDTAANRERLLVLRDVTQGLARRCLTGAASRPVNEEALRLFAAGMLAAMRSGALPPGDATD